MMKRLFQKNDNFSIRYKLFLSYLLLIVIPLFLFIMVTSYISSKDTEAKAFESARKVLSQASAFLQFKTSNIKNTLDIVVLDSTLHDIVTRNSDYYRENIGNGWTDKLPFIK